MPRAQSADGVIHDFPEGTDSAVIDRVMKDYATQPAPSGLSSYLRESLSAIKEAGPEVLHAAKDIGKSFVPGMDPRPGMERVGQLAQFLSGGLTSPLGVEARAVDPATRIGEASNLARELKAPAKIEKLEQQKTAPGVPLGMHPADYLGVMEAAARGDWRWLGLTLGRKGAETVMNWARNPNRRVEDLQKFLAERRQARVEGVELDDPLKNFIEKRRAGGDR
jgi:hypothetical protein